ncbi:MAG: hypothetical protein KME60_00270 [Cyanomargarita calcarea GSE-NOS-MK-12-04C]|jgi:hypothetical protein|uniref:Uncharacterized protein n=1 Tax=Cyanomargarita calcarea GSE-NOS-MK-12-04C TaxID=2839659 RepID=A0A951QG98_9CYAN|nr:hypothetical protein [Cyanomargarita calcarea GSE-NOS-MK-12-04C]
MQLSQKAWHHLVLSVVGVCSLSLPFTQTAEAREVRNFCNKQDSIFVAAETKNFWVSICGSDSPLTYVGVNKKTGQTVRLPLSVNGQESRGQRFEAVNGDYTYIVSSSNKGKSLTVKRGTRAILRESIIRGW